MSKIASLKSFNIFREAIFTFFRENRCRYTRERAVSRKRGYQSADAVVWLQIFRRKTSYNFTLILQSAKVSKYPQSIKIRFSTQSIKISAVSTPILTIKAPFFSIFQALTENLAENPSNFQKSQKTFAPNFGNSAKMPKTLQYFDILAVLCTLIFYWIFILLLWNLRKSAASLTSAKSPWLF